jgi:hypothetical protein
MFQNNNTLQKKINMIYLQIFLNFWLTDNILNVAFCALIGISIFIMIKLCKAALRRTITPVQQLWCKKNLTLLKFNLCKQQPKCLSSKGRSSTRVLNYQAFCRDSVFLYYHANLFYE